MRVVYAPGATPEWRAALSRWQRADLAAVHRQGKHLPDRTNHGTDERWRQAGCRTYEWRIGWHTVGSTDHTAHERVLIVPTDYGYEKIGIRRTTVFTVDPETGVTLPIEGWVGVWRWYVQRDSSTSFPPNDSSGVLSART